MSFKDALHVVSTRVFIKMIVPKWALGLHKEFRKTDQAFTDLQVDACFIIQAYSMEI